MIAKQKDIMKLFISYSRTDMVIADSLVAALEAEGFGVTIDRRDLPYGEAWQGELSEFIRECDTVVWLVSQSSIRSQWVNWELGEVQRLNKRLMPVVIGPVDPHQLPQAIGKIHLLPAGGIYEPDQHQKDLVTALNTDRSWLKTHTRLSDRAFEWRSRGEPRDLLLRGSTLLDAARWKDRRPQSAPHPSEATFDLIASSERGAKRQRGRLVALLTSALVLISSLAVLALLQRNEAIETRDAALLAESNFLAGFAREQMNLGNSADALALAYRALPHDPMLENRPLSQEALRALREADFTRQMYATLRAPRSAARPKRDVAADTRDQTVPNDTSGLDRGALTIQESLSNLTKDLEDRHRELSISTAKQDTREKIVSLAYSASGQLLVTGASNGEAHVWDTKTGILISRILAHEQSVVSVSFSSDDRQVLTVSLDGTAKLWNGRDGSHSLTFEGHSDIIWDGAFSQNGSQVATVSSDGTARLWSAETGEEVARMAASTRINDDGFEEPDPFRRLSMSPDGIHIAFAGGADDAIMIWSLADQTVSHLIKDYEEFEAVEGLAYAPDGSLLAASVGDVGVLVYDTRTAQRRFTLIGHQDVIGALSFSKDGELLATGSDDGQVRIWSMHSGELVAVLGGHSGRVNALKFSHSGMQVIGVGDDATVRIWSAFGLRRHERRKWGVSKALTSHTDMILDVAISPSGDYFTTASADGRAIIWDAYGGVSTDIFSQVVDPDDFATGPLYHAALSPRSDWLATSSFGGYVYLWSLRDDKKDRVLSLDGEDILSYGFNAAGTSFAIGGHNKQVRILNSETLAVESELSTNFWPHHVKFGCSDQCLLIAGEEIVAIWHWSEDGWRPASVLDHAGAGYVQEIEIASGGDRVATQSDDGAVRLFNLQNGNAILFFPANPNVDSAMKFDPSGKLLFFGEDRNGLKIFRAQDGALVDQLEDGRMGVETIAFDVEKSRVALGINDASIQVRNSDTLEEIYSLETGGGTAPSIAISPDGSRLLTGSRNGPARLWQLDNGELLAELYGHEDGAPSPGVRQVAFSEDGKHILTVGEDATARIWPNETDAARLIERVGQNLEALEPLSPEAACRYHIAEDLSECRD